MNGESDYSSDNNEEDIDSSDWDSDWEDESINTGDGVDKERYEDYETDV